MHTTTWSDDETTTVVFNHNGDYSGEVLVRVYPLPEAELRERDTDAARARGLTVPACRELAVPFDALAHLVAGKARSDLVAAIEDASDAEVLRLGRPDR